MPQKSGNRGTEDAARASIAVGWPAGYDFLAGHVDRAVLLAATHEAQHCGVRPHEVLIAQGWLASQDYVAALDADIAGRLPPPLSRPTVAWAVDAVSCSPAEAFQEARAIALAGYAPLLIDWRSEELLEPDAVKQARVDHAAHAFRNRSPENSAATPFETWQVVTAICTIGLLAGGLPVAGHEALIALAAALSIPFLIVVLFRLLALAGMGRANARTSARAAPLSDLELPIYTILVPLYQEAEIIADCVDALMAIDYPKAKLDIVLLLESDDIETITAAARLDLPGCVRLVAVPACLPRTKPKALNYGLALARGSHIVVYDAEDVPDPQQLRMAAALFASAAPGLACIQARLNIHNARASWLTRGIMAQTPQDLNPA